MIDLKTLTITSAHDALVRGDFTAVELAEAYLEQIKNKNPELNAYLEVYDDVLDQAAQADARLKSGERDNMLLGIPVAIKDNILIKGKKMTSASKILEGYVAPYTATAMQKLKDRGVVFLGRVNMDEFAMGASTENSAFGVTKNPIDTTRVSGGSSGGSACVVAGDLALVAIGSDTGGSIRQPASFCGVTGFKPSYGAVSRHGLTAMSSSLDQIGPIAKNVEDARIIFDCIRGVDSYDATTIAIDESNTPNKKIGIIPELLTIDGLSEEVKSNFAHTIETLKKSGYEIVDLKMPNISHALEVYYIICPAEVSSNMARFDGVRFGSKNEGSNLLEDYLKTRGELLGHEVKRRIMIGTYVLSSGYYDAFYGKANTARELIRAGFNEAFKTVDAILTPTTPSPAFAIGEKSQNPLEMYLADVFTVTANIVGVPAISIPSGKTASGLPLGLQLMGKYRHDFEVFELASQIEKLL